LPNAITIIRAKREFQKINLNLRNVEKTPRLKIAPWEEGTEKHIDLQMIEARNSCNQIKQDKFKELINNHEDHLAIYTDGSKTSNACGYAVVTTDEILFKKRLHNISSIYTAEIRAIILAGISHTHYQDPMTIYSDSMSSMIVKLASPLAIFFITD